MNWKIFTVISAIAFLLTACGEQAPVEEAPVVTEASSEQKGIPTFQVDPNWPVLPNNWITGEVSSVSVDGRDHVWLLHRPHTVAEENREHAAPPVIEFDNNGEFVGAWGGQGEGFDWPWNEHGLFLDHNGHVWIGGNNPTGGTPQSEVEDNMLCLLYTSPSPRD